MSHSKWYRSFRALFLIGTFPNDIRPSFECVRRSEYEPTVMRGRHIRACRGPLGRALTRRHMRSLFGLRNLARHRNEPHRWFAPPEDAGTALHIPDCRRPAVENHWELLPDPGVLYRFLAIPRPMAGGQGEAMLPLRIFGLA